MKTLKIIALLATLLPRSAPAQNADYQLRPSVHLQLPIGTNGQGVAGWLIVPNAMESKPKLYAASGWLLKKQNSWQEFMVGGLFSQDGTIKPALNFRAYMAFPKAGGMDFYSGFLLRPDRAIVDPYVTYPVGPIRLGLETELTAGLEDGIKSCARLGPRLSFKIPKVRGLTFATSALFDVWGENGRSDTVVVRSYLCYTFSKNR